MTGQQLSVPHGRTYTWSLQYLVHFLTSIGYHSVDAATIDGLYYYTISIISNISTGLHQWSQLSGRYSPHALDLYMLLKTHSLQPSDLLLFLNEQKSLYKHHSQSKSLELKRKPEADIENKVTTKQVPQPSIVSIFGEGIPPLPPIHTFKRTVIPVQRNFQASKIVLQTAIERRRLEQNLKNLLKFSQTGPKIVSYDQTMILPTRDLS